MPAADLGLISPTRDRIARQFCSVIADNSFRSAVHSSQRIEFKCDPAAGEWDLGDGRQILSREVVEDCQDAKAPAAGDLVRGEVQRPALNCQQRHRLRSGEEILVDAF